MIFNVDESMNKSFFIGFVKNLILTLLLFGFVDAAFSQNVNSAAAYAQAEKKVEPNWESIRQRPYPQWFNDAKLGIFIHWGLYSVPAFTGKEGYGEWYYRGLMLNDSARLSFQNKVYGEGFEYADFDKMFKAELFDAGEWADLFEKSGAKYVVLVTKHHDGYCLWDSEYAPDWNSVKGGPKRDIVGLLTEEIKERDMKMGFYYSLTEWTNPKHRWMVDPADSIAEYVETHMIPQFKELVSTYRPSLIFTDGEWENSAADFHAEELISWFYNLIGDEAIVNDRWGSGANYGFRTPEYSAGITITDRPWAECRGLGRSFGLNRNEPLSNYITSDQLIRHFVKLVACGGGLTLNVGPAADGQIPLLQQERLLDLGKWLEINGEAIYATRPYSKFYEEKDVELQRIDSCINFDWVRNSPDPAISYDNFECVWNGFITVDKSDDYTFSVVVDDEASLCIDGKMILKYDNNKLIDNSELTSLQSNAMEGVHGNVASNTVFLEAGVAYPFQMTYKEKDVNAKVILSWSSADFAERVVEPEVFSVDKNRTQKGLSGDYRSKQPSVCYTTKDDVLYAIALDYPQDELILNIPKPDKNAEVKMLGCDKILPWKYKNNKLIIDTKSLEYKDLKSTSAWVFKIG